MVVRTVLLPYGVAEFGSQVGFPLSGSGVASLPAWAVLVLLTVFGHSWTCYLPVLDRFKPGP